MADKLTHTLTKVSQSNNRCIESTFVLKHGSADNKHYTLFSKDYYATYDIQLPTNYEDKI